MRGAPRTLSWRNAAGLLRSLLARENWLPPRRQLRANTCSRHRLLHPKPGNWPFIAFSVNPPTILHDIWNALSGCPLKICGRRRSDIYALRLDGLEWFVEVGA